MTAHRFVVLFDHHWLHCSALLSELGTMPISYQSFCCTVPPIEDAWTQYQCLYNKI